MEGITINIENVSIYDLIDYNDNPRNNDEAVDYVKASIKEFGFKVPIVVDKNNEIIAGHTRKKAALEIGIKEVPVIVADDLSDEQVRAFRLADNKVAEFSEWDMELLQSELNMLEEMDMDDFGFDLSEDIDEVEVEEDDFDEEPPEDPIAEAGQIYQLGRHRVMCGDSTDKSNVNMLTEGNKIDMVFTDPPYNIDYKELNDDRKIKNDKMSDEDFVEFLKKSIMPCETTYVCCSWQYNHLFKKAMEEIGIPPKAMIVWDKVNPAQNLDKYYKQHELIYYYGKFGGQKTLRGDVWEVKRERNTVHPTMKPISLISMAINDNPKAENIYDSFGGSGSTLMACEQTGRKAYLMELDPKYVDVIINRWEQYTGEEAVLVNG